VCSDEKVTVVYNAVAVPEENQYNSASKNMLFLGVVGQRKGVYDLLQAVKQIDSKLPADVKRFIYGPDFEKKVEVAIAEQNLSERVKYCGWLAAEEKERVFADTAVNILPSYNEGLPMTILECMAHGIPNISTNVAAIPEAVNSRNGILIRPGDIDHLARAIEMMMSDKEVRCSQSENAYENAKTRFSVETHLHNIIDIYRELVEHSA
jgi:glycosyltransferase involved in cell wall biosynthesis